VIGEAHCPAGFGLHDDFGELIAQLCDEFLVLQFTCVSGLSICKQSAGYATTTKPFAACGSIGGAANGRIQSLLGRYLVDGDEIEGAPPVVVAGSDEWQQRFAGDPNVVGRALTVSGSVSTVVGVMPNGFGFPVRQNHWTPLRSEGRYGRATGPEITVIGRLANGANLSAAQAELAVAGARAAADFPSSHWKLVPHALPYTEWFFSSMRDGEIRIFQLIVLLLFGVIGANVAALVYARTAARHAEIAVRAALGASRWRIVTQMLVEGLVLSAAAALLGLVIAHFIRAQLGRVIARAPFWVDTRCTRPT
jgi:hypothetical protein